MSSARLLRPLVRAVQRPAARPSFAAFSTKTLKLAAPVTPSINAQLQARREAAASPKTQLDLSPMTKLVSNIDS
jgi:hypothetical protein